MSQTRNQLNTSVKTHWDSLVNSVESLGTKLSISVLISCEKVQCIVRVFNTLTAVVTIILLLDCMLLSKVLLYFPVIAGQDH